MKIFFSFFALLLYLQQPCYAQKSGKAYVDSLLTEFAKIKEDTTKVKLFAAIMYAHVYYKPEEGLTYQKAALELAQKINWKPGIAKIKDNAGRLHWRMGNFTEALKNHFEALSIYIQTANKYGEGFVLVEIAQDYLDNGKYDEAKIYLLKGLKVSEGADDKRTMALAYSVLSYLHELQGNIAESINAKYEYLKINEKLGNKRAIANAANALGSNAKELGNKTEALKYYKQGLQATKESGDKLTEAYFNSYIGNIYRDEGKFPEAKNYYSEALTLANEAKDVQLLADMHRGMGILYQAQGHYDEALNNYLVAEAEFKSIANKQDLASLYSEMGMVYTRLKKYQQAKKSFNEAMVLNEGLNSKLSMGDYYNGVALLDSATGNWKNAYQHYKQYTLIKDSTFNKETLKKLVASQMQYENEKKEALAKTEQEKKYLVVQEEIKRQRNIRNSAFAVLAVVLLFSVVVYRQRNKIAGEKKRSDQLLLDKELLLREIHHRVKNNLEVVSSLLALQSAQIDDPNTKEAMQEGQNRVQSIGIVHQKLYQGENLGAIEMKDYFINLSESILDSFGADKKVQIECAMDKLNIDIDTAVPLGLIVNELLTNTLKYAFPDGRNGKVQIKLEKRIDGILRLQVSDNGVGKSGLTKGTGFGSQLVALLTKQLSGSMREEVNNGTNIFFEFKIEKAA